MARIWLNCQAYDFRYLYNLLTILALTLSNHRLTTIFKNKKPLDVEDDKQVDQIHFLRLWRHFSMIFYNKSFLGSSFQPNFLNFEK
ncbi:hypothetical protein BpHYR1_029923 [Brachionus plicatilis]|uniref:Uncharacterized protein n=1 Tax=Brachionus plicatilis TaxID=10195 RepID=A0A3M7Q6L8_BRAPC|nr:hypothetical protein BpHYR1_029923 [Brachionus plicatilis]